MKIFLVTILNSHSELVVSAHCIKYEGNRIQRQQGVLQSYDSMYKVQFHVASISLTDIRYTVENTDKSVDEN